MSLLRYIKILKLVVLFAGIASISAMQEGQPQQVVYTADQFFYPSDIIEVALGDDPYFDNYSISELYLTLCALKTMDIEQLKRVQLINHYTSIGLNDFLGISLQMLGFNQTDACLLLTIAGRQLIFQRNNDLVQLAFDNADNCLRAKVVIAYELLLIAMNDIPVVSVPTSSIG